MSRRAIVLVGAVLAVFAATVSIRWASADDYPTKPKITLSSLGGLAKSGGTMTGDITVDGAATGIKTTTNAVVGIRSALTMTGTANAVTIDATSALGSGDATLAVTGGSGATSIARIGLIPAGDQALPGQRYVGNDGNIHLFFGAGATYKYGIDADAANGLLGLYSNGTKWLHVSSSGSLDSDQSASAIGLGTKFASIGAKRFTAVGTTPTSTAFVLTGWGATCASTPASCLSSISGDDSHLIFTVTATGASPTAAPTIAYTFVDGTWASVAPICNTKIETTGTLADQFTYRSTETATATVLTITTNDTTGAAAVVAGHTFKFSVQCLGDF